VSHNSRFAFTAKLQRRFTHERVLESAEVAAFKEGMFPILKAGRLGCVLMQFPWTFRYTEENREYFIRLRRAFHEFPLVAEMRHSSWMYEEALGTLIDYRVGFCNIDQAEYIKAMPLPASLRLQSATYVCTGAIRRTGNRSSDAPAVPCPVTTICIRATSCANGSPGSSILRAWRTTPSCS